MVHHIGISQTGPETMIKRTVFFWIDRLQILPAERHLITILFTALLIIGTVRFYWQPAAAFDHNFYEPVEAEFNRLSAIRSEEENSLLSRYYPQPVSGTKEPGGAFVTVHERPAIVDADTSDAVTAKESEKININQAGLDELTQLPGIGPVIAQRIIEYREEHGVFETADEILNVRGIGTARLEQIKAFLTL